MIEPVERTPLRLTTRCSPAALPCDGREHEVQLLIRLEPDEALRRDAAARPTPADLCVVLDASGSMASACGDSTRLDVARDAAATLPCQLAGAHTLSLVAFSHRAAVLDEGIPAGDSERWRRALQALRPDGETAIGDALAAAERLLLARSAHHHRRVLLLTDGHATDGENGIAAAERLASQGITIDAVGIGQEHHQLYLERLVAAGKGRSGLIVSPADARPAFEHLARLAGRAALINAELQVQVFGTARALEHYRGAPDNLYLGRVRYQDSSARIVRIALASLERDHRHDYYITLCVPAPGEAGGTLRLARCTVRADVPAWQRQEATVHETVAIPLVAATDPVPRDGAVELGVARAQIKRWERDADEARRRGAIAEAITCYRRASELCHQQGLYQEEGHYLAIIDSLQQSGSVSQALLNRAAHSSTRAADSGLLPDAGGPSVNPFLRRHRQEQSA